MQIKERRPASKGGDPTYAGAKRPPLQGREEVGPTALRASGSLTREPSTLRRRRPPLPLRTAIAEEVSATMVERTTTSRHGRFPAALSSGSGVGWSRALRAPLALEVGGVRASRASPAPRIRRGPRAAALTGPTVSHGGMVAKTCRRRSYAVGQRQPDPRS